VLTAFGISADRYGLNQLRYDLRKMKAHGLLERDGKRYAYRLSDKGTKVALMFVLFHNSFAAHSPTASSPPARCCFMPEKQTRNRISQGRRFHRNIIQLLEAA